MVSLFFAKRNRYTNSRIPTVFNIRRTMNQFLWSFLEALHKASPFQINVHTIRRYVSPIAGREPSPKLFMIAQSYHEACRYARASKTDRILMA